MRTALLVLMVGCLLTPFGAKFPVSAQPLRRAVVQQAARELPFNPIAKVVPGSRPQATSATAELPLQYAKLQFSPVRIMGQALPPPPIEKELPWVSRRQLNRAKQLAQERLKKPQTGLVVEAEAAYGIHDTFIGRLQHSTQFKGAHYSLSGHWEKTAGDARANPEENIAAQAKVDVDISKQTSASVESTYFQSDVTLPQLSSQARHEKSLLQIVADLQFNFETDTDGALTVEGAQSRFFDHLERDFRVNTYRGHLSLKHLWNPKSTLHVDMVAEGERLFQDDHHLDSHYYTSNTLLNSFLIADTFTVDAGMQFDYYYADDGAVTEYLIAPLLTTRLQVLRNTTLYTTYHPHLSFPRFADLYIHRLYTAVNPELHAEKFRYSVETGLTQRFGEAVSWNLGLFYHSRDNLIVQLDADRDNILEYQQWGAADFMGVKTSLQMNYREQLVQSLTYTYTDYEVSAGQISAACDSVRLPYHPNHQVQASLYWTTPLGLAIDFNGTYISEQFRDCAGLQRSIGKRFFLNLDVTQHFSDNFQVFLLGRNLTDTPTYDIIPLLDSEEITSSRLFIGGVRLRF